MNRFVIGLVLALVSAASGEVWYELFGASNAVTVTDGELVEYGYADESTTDVIIPVTWADSVGAKFFVNEHYPDGSVFRRSALYGVQQVGTTSRDGTFVFTKGGKMLPYGSNIPIYDFYHTIPAYPSEPSNDSEDGSTDEPIDTKNGNNYFTERRIFVPCPGVPLRLDLTYQSVADLPTGALGAGWRHSLEWYLDVQAHQAVLYTGDGRKRVFKEDGSGGYLPPFGKHWTLDEVAAGYEVEMPGGLYYAFDTNGVLSSIHDAWGRAMECAYGTNACLEYATHSNGRQIAFSNEWYAASGQWRATSISVKGGMSLAFDYNGDGQFTQVVEQVGANSYTSSYQYADSCLMKKVNGAAFEYSYGYETGTNGLLNGKGIHLDVDGYYEHEVEYIYPNLTEVRYSLRGAEQIYRYFRNRDGVLETKYGPGENVSNAVARGVTYAYTASNEDRTEETLFDNATGATWSRWMRYDAAHNITNFSVAYGTTNQVHQLSMEYDPAWQRPSAVTDATGSRFEILYTNALPRVFKVFYSASNSYDTCFSYTSNGLLQSFTNANEHVTTFGYDGMGNLTAIKAEVGPVITNTYDELGFVQSGELLAQGGASTGRITQYDIDAKGRVLQVHYPDGLTASFAYNALGYLTNKIDRAGHSTDFTYAPTERLTSVTRYLNESGSNVPVRIGYDLDEQVNLLRIGEPRGRYVESYQLDIQDRVTSITNIEDQVVNIDYSIGSFVDQITRFDHSTIEYAYDSAGRKSNMVYLAGSQTNAVIDFTYFANSQLESVSDAFSSVSNSYDTLNRLTNLVSSAGDSSVGVCYSYDPVGNVTNTVLSFNNPSITNLTTDFTYDAGERLTEISRKGAAAQSFVYSYSPDNGRVELVSNTVSGITCSYGHDLMNRTTNIMYRTSDGTLIRSLDYEYDAASMIARKTIAGESNFTSTAYVYDSIDRLVHESFSAPYSPPRGISYAYDLAGNRLSKTADGIRTNYTLGIGNRVDSATVQAVSNALFVCGTADEPIGTDNRWGELWITNLTTGASVVPSVNGHSFFARIAATAGRSNLIHAAIRDRAGNMGYAVNDYWVGANEVTSSVSTYAYDAAGCLTNLNGVSLEWDERYRLKSIDNASDLVMYQYDVLNRRVSRIEGTTTNLFVYDGNQIVADVDGFGNLLRTYVWGMGIDNLLSMTVYTNGGSQAAATYFAIKDHQNTVIAMVDSSGSVVESYEYDAYGNTVIRDAAGNELTESGIGNRYLFQGREIDWATGLYYFRARWYDPRTGRWLSKDPLGIAGGLNLYEFCANNPVNFIDPDGLDVVYLDDSDAVRGAGHAASAVGNDLYGWAYYSFGMGDDRGGSQRLGTHDNMTIRHYRTFAELRRDNPRYDKEICYKTSREEDMAAHREAISHIGDRYWFIGRNCDDVASSIIRAAGVDFVDRLRPNATWRKNIPNNEGLTK